MQFDAKQMKADLLIPAGTYKFRVVDAREKRSSAGNDMINMKLTLLVDGRDVKYFDSLILMPKMFWKIEHFCETVGMPEKIEEGSLMAGDCWEKEGHIEIIQKANRETGVMENQTKDYVTLSQNEAPVPDNSFLDDDIPNLQ
jgi:hypothetical protein